jgi:hypothetical protein
MSLRNSLRGYKSALTIHKKKITSLKQRRFVRLSAEEQGRQLRHWIETDQMIWTSDLVKLVANDVKKQGLHLM